MSVIRPAAAAPGVTKYSTSPRRAALSLASTSSCSSWATCSSVSVPRISRLVQKPSTRLLISSVNAAWNGDRALCSSSAAMARVIAARPGPRASGVEWPSAGTRDIATLVATTNPSGSTPMTRFSSAATGTARPACGRMRMMDAQLCQRDFAQPRTVWNIREINQQNRLRRNPFSPGGQAPRVTALPGACYAVLVTRCLLYGGRSGEQVVDHRPRDGVVVEPAAAERAADGHDLVA